MKRQPHSQPNNHSLNRRGNLRHYRRCSQYARRHCNQLPNPSFNPPYNQHPRHRASRSDLQQLDLQSNLPCSRPNNPVYNHPGNPCPCHPHNLLGCHLSNLKHFHLLNQLSNLTALHLDSRHSSLHSSQLFNHHVNHQCNPRTPLLNRHRYPRLAHPTSLPLSPLFNHSRNPAHNLY